MNHFCISHGSVVTFFRCGDGQVHSHGYSLFYSEITQINQKYVLVVL